MESEKISSVNILGVRVDKVTMDQAVELVGEWLSSFWSEAKESRSYRSKTPSRMTGYYIVTPNPEFLMLAQKDKEFRDILNKADLAIPDGSRLGWASRVLQEKNFIKKFLIWSTFLFPCKQVMQFDNVTGVELMERLCKASVDWARLASTNNSSESKRGSTIGLLGGKDLVAEKTAECLQKRYSKIKIVFAESGGEVDSEGCVIARSESDEAISGIRLPRSPRRPRNDEKIDILFVAFGQGKQEKWIAHNLKKLPVKVMMGVGGSFDEISGLSPKPPKLISDLKLKWLFRLVTEPWRIKRQLQLVKFLWLVLALNTSTSLSVNKAEGLTK